MSLFSIYCLSNNLHCQKPNIPLYLSKAANLDRSVSIELLRSAVLRYSLRTAEVCSSMDTSPLCTKVSIKLLRSAVLWRCLESVHRTADLGSFMDTVGKGSIKLRGPQFYGHKKIIFLMVAEKCPLNCLGPQFYGHLLQTGWKVSIKLLRSSSSWVCP